MKTDSQERQLCLNRLREACKASGVKVTSQRLAIFSYLALSPDHPDAETVHKSVVKKLPAVSLDTVYRNLWRFVDMGLATILSSPLGRRRFEANMSHHHHFVCLECGVIQDFSDPDLEPLKIPKSLARLGRVEKTAIEFRGRCQKCLDASSKKASSKKQAKRKK